ncbi:yjeF C-terminal region, hydroxyethylthiazole kinase-related [Noviherbaspirillum humi]|uniref:ADP-dependent (S)-NAD(P)H-hydrate dehydratase n=1 Tax=Noviherbaspirillum humi TaxID=1688639 RepID=A0A239C794_9BURK|nr:NAD(P)H-hydrate dehydratase [Noviherbaspirillum humi]SNS15538.1 yjeF C-terminal region, hydroxyethylthiazole kinase-related [Noviherbaspirillum humi]
MTEPDGEIQLIDDDSLRAWPLPMPAMEGDKEERGRALIVAGSREMPGAALLAVNAALRAGAGKVTLATGESIALHLAIALPEARVVALPETDDGAIAPELGPLRELAPRYAAVLIGPGMQNEEATCALAAALLPLVREASVVIDASAMAVLANGRRIDSPVLITPHAGEMAHLSGDDKESIQRDPLDAARRAARRWNVLVAMKGATTFVAHPDGRAWRHDGGNVGLAVSGSGDTLAGIIVGLAARGAPLEQACAWGVALHARAGERLSIADGLLGYLARDIPAQVPGLMRSLRSN